MRMQVMFTCDYVLQLDSAFAAGKYMNTLAKKVDPKS